MLLQQEIELFSSKKWHTIILDEAQFIKNHAAKRSQAVMDLQGDFRIITTGTPVENHLGELWTLFRFLNPGLLGSLNSFNSRFAIPIEQRNDREARIRLRRLIAPFILRRTKTQVLDELPGKTEIVIRIEQEKEEIALYDALRRSALEKLSSIDMAKGTDKVRVLAEITRLRRMCCHPSLVLPGSTLKGSKLSLFGERVDELIENGHRALVFSQFVDHLSVIRNYLDERKIEYAYLDGSTPAAQRKTQVDNFQSGKGSLFLISLKAGGVGLNLTGADYVFHMDPWWNPAVEDQASDRAYRIGQTRPVTVYRFITKNTIEEKIVDLHRQKRELADSLLEGSDTVAAISVEELLELIKD
jgi:SNF2 family DNA or RNA helicase